MFCSKCGAKVLVEGRFCQKCGHQLSDTTTDTTKNRTEPIEIISHILREDIPMAKETLQERTVSIEKVASGQKFVIYALRVYVVSICLNLIIGDLARLVAIGNIVLSAGIFTGIVLSLIGVFRLCSGMGYSIGAKTGLIVLMIVPLINIFTLWKLNSCATKSLRASGLEVALLNF